MKQLLGLAVALLWLQPGSQAFAQQKELNLDPVQTEIHFTLKTSLHTVHGSFRLKSGTLSFDGQTKKLSGLIVVDAASGGSGNSGRDSKMHKDILESQKYPEIAFDPHEVEGDVETTGESRMQVKGTIRLHGQDHEVEIPVAMHLTGREVTLDTEFSIPYLSWGLKNPSTFILRASDTVLLSIHAVGHWAGDWPN